ncbi:MAG: metalloregulator ArsR/SmtB family transcription factor [Spirochaetota bacterium]
MSKPIDFNKDSEILKAIGHPVRLKLITGLMAEYECNVNKMVEKLKLPQSTVSQHLAVLKNRGIIVPRKDGVNTCYEVVDKRVKEIIKILQS